MNDVGFAIVLALAWFATVNVAASGLVALLAAALDSRMARFKAATASRVLLVLRLLPGAVSVFFTLALFLPAHWRLEPEGVEESAGYSLLLLAALGALILVMTAWRTIVALRATGWIGRTWLRHSRRGAADAGGVPIYHVTHPSPIVSLVGVFRPRVFVSTTVLQALTEPELEASIAHELAHCEAGDNFKRVLVACSPDVLLLAGVGRRVEDQWRAALEFAADARAVGDDRQRALDLVSALVKVARLAPVRRPSLVAARSDFYDGALLSARIGRLLDPDGAARSSLAVLPMWPVSLAGLALAAVLLPSHTVWLVVHLATEGLVRILP